MRIAFTEELQFISDQLVEMARLTSAALEQATTALMTADLELAEHGLRSRSPRQAQRARPPSTP